MKNKKINISSFLTLMASGIVSCAILSSSSAVAGRDDDEREGKENKDFAKESKAGKADSAKVAPEDHENSPFGESLTGAATNGGPRLVSSYSLTSGAPTVATNGGLRATSNPTVGTSGDAYPSTPPSTNGDGWLGFSGGAGGSGRGLPFSPGAYGAYRGLENGTHRSPWSDMTHGGATRAGWGNFPSSPGAHGAYTWGGQGNGQNPWAHMMQGINASHFPKGPYSQEAGMAAARAAIIAYITTYTQDYSSGTSTSGETPGQNQSAFPMGGGFSPNGASNSRMWDNSSFQNGPDNRPVSNEVSGGPLGFEVFTNNEGSSTTSGGFDSSFGPDRNYAPGTSGETSGQNQPTDPSGGFLPTTPLFQGGSPDGDDGSLFEELGGGNSTGLPNQNTNSMGYYSDFGQ